MARESRQLMPVARTQTEVTNRLAAMAITMMTPQISQSGAVLSKPTHGGAEEQDKRQLWGPISQRGIKTEAQGSARQKRRENAGLARKDDGARRSADRPGTDFEADQKHEKHEANLAQGVQRAEATGREQSVHRSRRDVAQAGRAQ